MDPVVPLALVTGAGRRLGRSVALHLSTRGFAVAIHYHRSRAEAVKAMEEIRSGGGIAWVIQADLSFPEQITRLLDEISNLPHPLQLLVNSAAVMPRANIKTLTPGEWDQTLALNLRAPFMLSQGAARLMNESGLIINLTDAGSQKAWTGYPAYIVSKAGLEALTRVLARALAPQIRVNAIAPGLILPADDLPRENWEQLKTKVPMQREGDPEDIHRTIDFLIQNKYITGEILRVDGGYHLV